MRPYNQGSDFPTLLALIVAVGFPLLLLSLVFDIFPRESFDRLVNDLKAKAPFLAAEVRPSPSPVVARLASPTPVNLTVADWQLPNGHFYTQTNGQAPLTSATGYAVINEGGLAFWDFFQRLGGVDAVGHPLSNRFLWRGFAIQVFEKLIFQGPETGGDVNILNVMDELGALGKDDWLKEKLVPLPLPPDFDAGRPAADVPAAHLALLADDPALEKAYKEAKDSLLRFGLPSSKVTDMGDYLVAIRCQRTVLQHWKKEGPWGKAGAVTVANAGQLAVEAGLFPTEGLQPTVSAPPQGR